MSERSGSTARSSGCGAVVPSADEDASGRDADPREYDVDHYGRVLRDTYAARLVRALTPTDFATVFTDPDHLSLSLSLSLSFFLFAPPTSSMRPVLDTRPAPVVSAVDGMAGADAPDQASQVPLRRVNDE